MKRNNKSAFAALLAGATLLVAGSVAADSSVKSHYRAHDVLSQDENSLETLTPFEQLKTVASGNVAPTEIWRRLEHGEKVECLECIPEVSKLLYDSHAKNREIAAWWLRRRIFGVFGPGQVYQTTLQTATDMSKSETQRAYAVDALGEFLEHAGVGPVSQALTSDPSAKVRWSAAHALWRMNSQGANGALAKAIGDKDESVRLEAIKAASRIHVFTGVDAIVQRISDESPRVRKRAAETLGAMRSADAVVGLIALTSPDNESDADVRAAAVWALGQIADPAARDAVQAALKDPNAFVRNAAQVASRRI
ncbi:MAG: HEAT repeat domain-containing protein [Polyangiaceae bacterium]